MTGISGINSLWWAKHGAGVTIVDDNARRLSHIKRAWEQAGCKADFIYQESWLSLPLENDAVDLSWNFAALWWLNDLVPIFAELARISRKAILICVPNNNGVGLRARKIFDKESVAKLKIGHIDPIRIKSALSVLGWGVRDEGLFDIPPWPDIAMKKEDLLRKLKMGWLASRLAPKESSTVSILDYYKDAAPSLEDQVLKYAFLEKAPRFFRSIWAHHRYFLFTPAN